MKFLNLSRLIAYAVPLLFTLVLYSCQKEDSSIAVTDAEAEVYAEESIQAESGFDDIGDISMSAADEEGKVSMGGRVFLFVDLRLRIGQCAEITVTPMDSTYPKTITIDFGNGCLGPDGKLRKGKIVITLTGPIRRPGSVATITLVDFFLNRAHIEGTKTRTNLSENGHVKFNVVVTEGKITFPNGRGYKYTSTKTVTQIEGATTNNIHDDVYSIAARSRTDFNNGLSINLNTESNFIKKVACYWVSDGVLKIKINNRVLFLDFGAPSNGNCDNKALLTWNNGAGQRLILLP